MAKLELQGFDELNEAFHRLGNVPENVVIQALDAMAEIAAARIKAVGESMGVRDPESDVHILDKIKMLKAKTTADGGYKDVTFSGTRTRNGKETRNAEIAFINEYGKEGQPARPFIGTAMSRNEAEIAAPGAEILGDWIEKTFEQ